jgi:hypothetical protein
LSICFQEKRNDEDIIEKGMKWYLEMIDDYPENFAFAMGYAHLLCNKSIFDEAIDYYERVKGMKHNWVRPLECMAYIYEYKRVLKNKSV